MKNSEGARVQYEMKRDRGQVEGGMWDVRTEWLMCNTGVT